VLHTFTARFPWASYDDYASLTVGQFGWAYSVYPPVRFGAAVHPVSFYTDSYRHAFPIALVDFTEAPYPTPAKFERGLNWFGLLAVSPPTVKLAQPAGLVRVSPLLEQLLKVLLKTS